MREKCHPARTRGGPGFFALGGGSPFEEPLGWADRLRARGLACRHTRHKGSQPPADTEGGHREQPAPPSRSTFPEKGASSTSAQRKSRIRVARRGDRDGFRPQGRSVGKIRRSVRNGGTGYGLGRKRRRRKLNAWPQFVTKIDGPTSLHPRSALRHQNALSGESSTHGWRAP